MELFHDLPPVLPPLLHGAQNRSRVLEGDHSALSPPGGGGARICGGRGERGDRVGVAGTVGGHEAEQEPGEKKTRASLNSL